VEVELMPARTLSVEDQLGVIQLIADYARLIDAGDVEGWLDNFLPDAVLDTLSGVATGRDEIRAWVTRLLDGGVVAKQPRQLVHVVGLPHVQRDGDRYLAQTYCMILEYDRDGRIRIPLVGRYEDVCVQVDGRWYFQRRIIHGDLNARARQ
jgi:SnoaL-like domain